MNWQFARGLLGIGALTACSTATEPVICSNEGRYGISVTVRDSVAGTWAGSGALLIVRDERGLVDSTVAYTLPSIPDPFDYARYPLSGAFERAGRFQVTIRQRGYQDWVRNDVVVVAANACHVATTALAARLIPR